MSRPLVRVLLGVAAFLVVCGVGALGYMAAGWSALDAVYMVVIKARYELQRERTYRGVRYRS